MISRIAIRPTVLHCGLSFLVLVSFSSWAKNIELKECYLEAAQNNPTFLAYKSQHQYSRLQLKSAYGNYLPKISASVTNNRSGQLDQTTGRYQYGITGSLNLFNGFGDNAQLKVKRANVDIEDANLSIINATISYQVNKAFYELLYLQENIQLLKKIKDRRKIQLDMIGLRYKGGREDKGSYLQAKAKYHSAEFDIISAQRELVVAQENLAAQIGYKGKDKLVVVGEFDVTNSIEFNPDDVEAYVRSNPNYRKQLSNIDVAKGQIAQADAEFYPQVDLSSSLGKSGEHFDNMDENSWSVGVTLTLPLFSGGTRYYASKSARVNKVISSYNAQNQFNSTKNEILSAYHTYINSIKNVKIQKEFLSASNLRAEVTTGKYKSGLTTYTDWDLVQSELINYEKNVLLSIKSAILAQAEFINALGRGEL